MDAWKFEDDLSSFRHSVVNVNSTKKALNTFEIGKAGLSIKSIIPVIEKGGEPWFFRVYPRFEFSSKNIWKRRKRFSSFNGQKTY